MTQQTLHLVYSYNLKNREVLILNENSEGIFESYKTSENRNIEYILRIDTHIVYKIL